MANRRRSTHRRIDRSGGSRPSPPGRAEPGGLWPSLALRGAKNSPGAPLDEPSREYFEPRFGRDLSDVRVHTGSLADESARGADALAYTSGSDIVFADGEYAPSTDEGKRLLAHELTHVVQQEGVPSAAGALHSGGEDAMEREAENAALVAVGPPGTIAASAYASSPAVLRAAGGAAFPGTVPIIDYVSDAAVIVIDGAGEAHVLTPTAFADEWSPRNPANPLVKTSNEAYAAAWRQIVPSHGIPIKGNRPAPDAGISVELADAPAGASSAERVIGWLQLHKADIVAAESDFDIDRRAIAGAIAWEALENVRGTAELKAGRFAGPGKVHVKSSRVVPAGIATFGTVAEEAEAASILPTPKDTEAREKLLATPSGAIRYVGGIMKLGADIALRHGFDIDHDPRMLCFFFQAMDSAKWEKLLKAHKPGTPLETKESMSIWVTENMPLLESAVGTPAVPGAAAATASPTPAGPDPHGPATNELKDRAIKLGYEIAEWVTEADESGPAAITVRLVRDGNELTPSFETRPEPHFERPSSRTSMTMGRVLQNLEAPIGVWVLQDGELKAEWIRDSGGYMKFSFSITRASGTREPAPATPP